MREIRRIRKKYVTVTSSICNFSTTCFMVSTGHGDPAMIPVDRLERSKVENSGWFSMSMNMVGTPYKDVHLLDRNNKTTWTYSIKVKKHEKITN